MSGGTHSPYLGEHVVGQRVVVRRLVPGEAGPTGGPAFTDVLGTCVAWDPCVLLTAAGERVTIPLDLIVSGKPVPPRPSVRMRATVADCEALVAGLWPSVTTSDLGGWTVRDSPDVDRKRANSCLAVVPPSLPLAGALDAVVAHYRAVDRKPLVAVERESDLESSIIASGWLPEDGDALFLLAAASRTLRTLPDPHPGTTVAWEGAHARAQVDLGRGPVARCSAALEGDWLGLHDLHVEPGHRRSGLARSLVAALADWGAAQGARTLWLHVEDDNAAALALYEAAGFAEHHRMRYLRPGN